MDDPCDAGEAIRRATRTALRAAERAVLPVLLELDELHHDLAAGSAPAGRTPSDRWHQLADDLLSGTPAGAPSRIAADAAAYLVMEAAAIADRIADAPLPGPGTRRAEAVRDEALSVASRLVSCPAPEHAVPQRPDPASEPRHGHPRTPVIRTIERAIDVEEAWGSIRHRPVSPAAKIVAVGAVLAVDLPVTFWLATAVLPTATDGLPGLRTACSALAAAIASIGVAVVPYQLGRDHRTFKQVDGRLHWTHLPAGRRIEMAAVLLLVTAVSGGVLAEAVSAEPVVGSATLVRLIGLAAVLALPVAAAMLFGLGLRDGSPEQDELKRVAWRLLRTRRARRRAQEQAEAARRRLWLVRGESRREQLMERLEELEELTGWMADEPVVGPRGHLLTVAEAEARVRALLTLTDGSPRHHRVGPAEMLLGGVAPAVVDVPLLLAVVVAVAGSDPAQVDASTVVVGLAAVTAVVAAATVALRFLARDHRRHKTDARRMDWAALGWCSRVTLTGVGLLVLAVAASVAVGMRIVLRSVTPNGAAMLCGIGAALVVVASVLSVARTAFRDGSYETDDLAGYRRAVRPWQRLRRAWGTEAGRIRNELGSAGEGLDAPRRSARWAARVTDPVPLIIAVLGVLAVVVVPGLLDAGVRTVLPLAAILAMPLVLIVARTSRRHPGGRINGLACPIGAGPRRSRPGRDWVRR